MRSTCRGTGWSRNDRAATRAPRARRHAERSTTNTPGPRTLRLERVSRVAVDSSGVRMSHEIPVIRAYATAHRKVTAF
jgi:hypothetical protein